MKEHDEGLPIVGSARASARRQAPNAAKAAKVQTDKSRCRRSGKKIIDLKLVGRSTRFGGPTDRSFMLRALTERLSHRSRHRSAPTRNCLRSTRAPRRWTFCVRGVTKVEFLRGRTTQ